MINRRNPTTLTVVSLVCILAAPVMACAQILAARKPGLSTTKKQIGEVTANEADEIQRRTFAVSLITALAEEARSYSDLRLRSRVLARAADTLWEIDNVTARDLFRRAWASAALGDAEEVTVKTEDNPPAMVMALRRIGGRDLRAEVLKLVASRDRALGEELLKDLSDDGAADAEKTTGDKGNTKDGWMGSPAMAKRLQLARRLLDDDQVDRAIEFAVPALDQVNAKSIGFLSALRRKRPENADQRFLLLLTRAALDSTSDANTVSGLSSYVFTPNLYVTFSPDGGAIWSQDDQIEMYGQPNLPDDIRARFFETATSILMRPSPPPDRDFSSSGRTGKYMVLRRLLPLFVQYAPDAAQALRGQLLDLSNGPPARAEDNPLLTQSLEPEGTSDQTIQNMQERLDRAKNSHERDSICADAAVALANRGDARAPDIVSKIDDVERRAEVARYVNLRFILHALQEKKASEVGRLAKTRDLTHVQRSWAFTQAARLLMNSERPRSLGFLGDATDEARRIGATDPDRARSLINVAKVFVTVDPVRAWELMIEASDSANASENFTGEDFQISYPVATKSGINIVSIGGQEFGLAGALESLARDDLSRSIELARRFRNPRPRANATLAVAAAVLRK